MGFFSVVFRASFTQQTSHHWLQGFTLTLRPKGHFQWEKITLWKVRMAIKNIYFTKLMALMLILSNIVHGSILHTFLITMWDHIRTIKGELCTFKIRQFFFLKDDVICNIWSTILWLVVKLYSSTFIVYRWQQTWHHLWQVKLHYAPILMVKLCWCCGAHIDLWHWPC